MPDSVFYLVRHGQTEANVKRILQGANTDTPLTALGTAQIQELLVRFEFTPLQAIYSSPQPRALVTAEGIAQAHGLSVKTASALRERWMGPLDGAPDDILTTVYAREYQAFLRLTAQQKFRQSLLTMESDLQIADRVMNYLASLIPISFGKTSLAVTHSGVMKSVLQYLGYATYDELSNTAIKNAGYMKMIVNGSLFTIDEAFGIEIGH